MRIGLQGPRRQASYGGAATFEGELFEGLVASLAKCPHQLVVFSKHPRPAGLPAADLVEWVRVGSVGTRNLLATGRRITNWSSNYLLQVPSPFRSEHWIDSYLRKHRVEFFLNLIPETIPSEVPYMTFVWDLLHRVHPYFPEGSQQGTWPRREWLFTMLVQRASIIGVATEETKKEVAGCYHVPQSRIHVMPYPTPQFVLNQPQSSGATTKDYVYYPAAFFPHKNHLTILRALAILRDRHHWPLRVVFTGSDWGNLDYVKKSVRDLRLEEQVRFAGFVSREELIKLYQGALALVFASLCGPGNIPPLEAAALGCPAIVADTPGAAEQMKGAALLFPPTDENLLAEAILKLRDDLRLRESLIQRGKVVATAFTREDLGLRTLQLIRDFEPVRRCWSSDKRFRRRFNVARLFGG